MVELRTRRSWSGIAQHEEEEHLTAWEGRSWRKQQMVRIWFNSKQHSSLLQSLWGMSTC